MTTEQLIIEGIARMDQKERESLVRSLCEKYPHLADSLMTCIGFELMDRDFENPSEYSGENPTWETA